MGYAQRYGLAVGAFAIASGAIAPLSAHADTPITQLKYDVDLTLDLPEIEIFGGPRKTNFGVTIEVDDFENRLTSGKSLTPTFSQLRDLLGKDFFEDAFFDALIEVQSFSGYGTVFDSAEDGAATLTEFSFEYVDGDQDEFLNIFGYFDDFKAGKLDQCLDGTCFVSGNASGVLLTDLFLVPPEQPFNLKFELTQTATPLGPTNPPPDDGVAVPEPSVGLGLLAIAGGGLMLKRRQDRAKKLETA